MGGGDGMRLWEAGGLLLEVLGDCGGGGRWEVVCGGGGRWKVVVGGCHGRWLWEVGGYCGG